jgi:hypothetical protein
MIVIYVTRGIVWSTWQSGKTKLPFLCAAFYIIKNLILGFAFRHTGRASNLTNLGISYDYQSVKKSQAFSARTSPSCQISAFDRDCIDPAQAEILNKKHTDKINKVALFILIPTSFPFSFLFEC